jgi:hypothetical protein
MAILSIAVVSAPTYGQQTAAKSDQTYSIQRVFKAGDVDLYKMKITQKASLGGQDVDIKMNLEMKETTKSVGDSGQVTVTEEYTKANANIGGQDMDLAQMMPKITLKKDKAGQVEVSTEGGQEPAVGQISSMAKKMMQSQAAQLPTKPVKIGDTWTNDVTGLSEEADAKTKMTMTLEGIETINGIKTLKLKSVSDTTGGTQSSTKMHAESTMYLDAISGKPVKLTSKADGTVSGSKFSSEMVLERGGPEEAKTARKDSAPK